MCAQAPGRRARTAGLAAVFVLALALPAPAPAQCLLQGAPYFFDPPSPSGWPPNGFESRSDAYGLFQTSAGRRLAVRATYGYVVYDLAVPDRPAQLDFHDIHVVPGYERSGDGQSTVNNIGVAADGSRLLVAYNDTHGTLVMPPDQLSTSRFTFGGDFFPSWTTFGGGLAVDVLPSGRTLAYALPRGGLYVADVTVPLTGGAQYTPGAFPREAVSTTIAPVGVQLNSLQAVTAGGKHYVLYSTGARVVLLDVTNPGPPPASMSSGFLSRVFEAADFGFPLGTTVLNLSAAEHPVSGELHLLAEGRLSTGPSGGVVLAKASVGSGLAVLSRFDPPSPYDVSPAQPFGASVLLPTADDLLGFFWEKATDGTMKLFSLAASAWESDLSEDVAFTTADGPYEKASVMRGFRNGSAVYLYTGNYSKSWAMKLSCVSPTAPAAPELRVEPDPCPGASPCPLAEGATVYLGDRLKVSASVSPPPDVTPLEDWRFDWDFHVGDPEDDGAAYPRLAAPDLAFPGDGAKPPASLTLVGPCDPKGNPSAVPATGAGCWASVLGNGDHGGPDFVAPVTREQEGTYRTLSVALEARNANNAAGTAGLTRRGLRFTVPRVRLAGSTVLRGEALVDGSDGHPVAAGHRWHFGSDPSAPAGETLVRDTACDDSLSCAHVFAAGPGSYNWWLEVPYANGYVSEACGSPCTRSRGTVTVSDVRLAFTAPSTFPVTQTAFTVTDQSVRGSGVSSCPAGSSGYEYSLCDASAGSCPASSFSPLDFTGGAASVSAPGVTGTYWLRVRYAYTTTGACGAPRVETWRPSVAGVSDPTAWPIAVTGIVPTIWLKFAGAGDVCPAGFTCPPFEVRREDALVAYALVSGVPDPSPPAGVTWDFGEGAAPATGAGTPSNGFRYTTIGAKTITLSGYSQPVTAVVNVATCDVSCPDPPAATVAAAPNPAAAGEAVAFTCSASGGTGPYTFAWTFGDGGTATGARPSHAYAAAGTFEAACTLTDFVSRTATAKVSVTVNPVETAAPLRFHTLEPCRVLDTRLLDGPLGGPALAPQSQRTFGILSVCGVPATARAIAANVTVAGASVPGNLRVFPGGGEVPLTSVINFAAGAVRANNAVISLGPGATFGVQNDAGGAVHLLVDVVGYFRE